MIIHSLRDIDKMSLCMLFADLRLEGTTLGSIDPIPGENIRDGDTYGDGGDYQRGIQAVHAGSPPPSLSEKSEFRITICLLQGFGRGGTG